MREIKGRLSSAHLLFSLLLLNSLIMSDRKSRRTSINSVLGAEFFSKVAITLRITNIRHKIQVKHTGEWQFSIYCIFQKGAEVYLGSESSLWSRDRDEGCELPVCTPALSGSGEGGETPVTHLAHKNPLQ